MSADPFGGELKSRIVKVAIVDAAVIAAGAALFLFTDDLVWIYLAALVSMATGFLLLALPAIRHALDHQHQGHQQDKKLVE
jgi:fatty acid desaturase